MTSAWIVALAAAECLVAAGLLGLAAWRLRRLGHRSAAPPEPPPAPEPEVPEVQMCCRSDCGHRATHEVVLHIPIGGRCLHTLTQVCWGCSVDFEEAYARGARLSVSAELIELPGEQEEARRG